MSKARSRLRPTTGEWPDFTLDYTFNPDLDGVVGEFAPDEVVLFDRERGMTATQWLSAERGSYVSLDEVR
ncbi:hypothetical protein SAMN04487948_12250 [Halogranum amylolyticum]|uniref:Uncharacterized protein n=1 Tax=Halogranum amylolyticum TaxID=660520 RepID=A0A1H8W2G8_9EURY|nr:hypothetical protein [Halogranum amylolyticum]SEP21836.1 hypothetical protein SAMN04487948_12250 [Halogranum amylolyticum]